jgi:hypothetical protein
MNSVTFNIPATKKSSTEIQLTKFNKRAAKLNMARLSWTFGKAFTKKIDRVINTGIDVIFSEEDVLFTPITITGDLDVSFDGWQFIATLQHLKTGENIIRSIGNLDFNIPENYRNSGSACEHCEVNRYRKETYLLKHINGDMVQVGSSCIKDFLGANTPESLMNAATLVSEIFWYMGGAATGGSGGDIVFPMQDFLAKTSAIINKCGWVSKKEASINGIKSTASLVLDELIPACGTNFTPIKVSDKDLELANQALNWLDNMSDEECAASDYLHNIRAIARSGMVSMKTVGFAASIISTYNTKLLRDKPKPKSQHIGAVKQKIQANLTLKIYYTFASKYGLCHRYVFNDSDGNVLVWLTSKDQFLLENKPYTIQAIIK